MKIVTTSWDDGFKESIEIAEMLKDYNIQGTFYVPVNPVIGRKTKGFSKDENFLSEKEIERLNKEFEIGAHGMAHHFLTEVSPKVANKEIKGSKKWLENLLNEEINGFAYPAGKFNEEIIRMVEKAGYSYARTVGNGEINFYNNRYRVPVSIFCYNSIIRRLKFTILAPFSKVYAFGGDWVKSAIKAFRNLEKEGGVLHIAEHPNRIKDPKFKKKMEKVFSKISNHSEVDYLTNEQTVIKVLDER